MDTIPCIYCGVATQVDGLFIHMETCLASAQRAAVALLPGEEPALALPRDAFCDASPPSIASPPACEIVPGLYLGNVSAARDATFLKRAGISLICNAAEEALCLPPAALAEAGVDVLLCVDADDREDGPYVEAVFQRLVDGASALAAGVGLDTPPLPQQALQALADACAVFNTAKREGEGGNPAVPATLAELGPDAARAAAACGSPRRAALVHCAVGRSRSATVLLLYLMLFRGLSLAEALSLAKARRPLVLPNVGFLAALVAVDERLPEFRAAALGRAKSGRFELGKRGAPAVGGGRARGAARGAEDADALVEVEHVERACSLPAALVATHPACLRRYDAYTGRKLREGATWAAVAAAAGRAAAAYLSGAGDAAA